MRPRHHPPQVLLPVEALAYYQNALYYSQGKQLFVRHSEQHSWYVCTLPHHIHMLKSVNETLYIAAGDKLCKLSDNQGSYEEIPLRYPDRVLDVYFHDEQLYYITAHAYLHNITSNLVYALFEHMLLYSACIGVYKGKLTAALGTIFSGVLLVRIKKGKLSIYKRFEEHKGSVFGIAMNNDTIASVSDDRNLLLYKRGRDKKMIKCIQHGSRVWKVMLLEDPPFAVSIGEDSQCIVWNANTGEVVTSFTHPAGKAGIISLATDLVSITAGCYDGSIIRWSLPEHDKPSDTKMYDFEGFGIKNFCVLDYNIVVVSNDGTVYWNKKVAHQCKAFTSYTVLHPDCLGNGMLVGTKSGDIYFVSEESIIGFAKFDEKINAIFTVDHYMCVQMGQRSKILTRDPVDVVWECDGIATAFAIIDRVWMVGDRNGRLLIKDRLDMKLNDKDDAITCIEDMQDHIRVIDRSGLMTLLDRKTYAVISQTRPLTGAIIERSQGDLLYGFHYQQFFIYSLSQGQKVCRVFCAGQHRRWQLSLQSRLFVFLRDGDIYLTSLNFIKKDILRQGGHQREIRDALVLTETLVVAVGEDNDVFIIDTARNTLHKQPTAHTSGIKCITGNQERILTAGGGNEVREWMVHLEKEGMPCLIPTRMLETGSELDCRIMSIDTDVHKGRTLMSFSDDRIQKHVEGHDKLFVEPKRCQKNNYAQHVRIMSEHSYIAACSDGCLYHVSTTSESKLKIHQSGINCLTMIEYNGERLVITGGDDHVLCICKVASENEHDSPVTMMAKMQAHSTAINGIAAFIQEDHLFIITVGLDRLLLIHQYTPSCSKTKKGKKKFKVVARFEVDVADAAVLRLLSHDSTAVKVFVGGVGYGVYRVPYAY